VDTIAAAIITAVVRGSITLCRVATDTQQEGFLLSEVEEAEQEQARMQDAE
jgi:hypothetical protein